MINDFMTEICSVLNINKPSVSYDTSHFTTNTMMAQCDPSGDTIYLKKKDKPDPDYLFSIAHELRHVWQLVSDKDLYFSNYKPIDMLDIEIYNNQLAEIDANAFASLIMIDFFHLQPLYHGLSASTIANIKTRMKIISCELTE